jgi:hypothetical protein
MKLVAECLVPTRNILLVPASFGQDSCCIWPRNLSVGVSDGHTDQKLLLIICSLRKFVDVSIFVNQTVHRNSSLLLTICLTDASNLAKSSFLHFQNAEPTL